MAVAVSNGHRADNGHRATAAVEAVEACYRLELAKAQMQLVLYRRALEENGIEPPDRSGADLLAMWRDCQNVIRVANEFVARLGTSKELLSESWTGR